MNFEGNTKDTHGILGVKPSKIVYIAYKLYNISTYLPMLYKVQ